MSLSAPQVELCLSVETDIEAFTRLVRAGPGGYSCARPFDRTHQFVAPGGDEYGLGDAPREPLMFVPDAMRGVRHKVTRVALAGVVDFERSSANARMP